MVAEDSVEAGRGALLGAVSSSESSSQPTSSSAEAAVQDSQHSYNDERGASN